MLSQDDVWHCLVCKVKFHHYNYPFTLRENIEIENLDNSNSIRLCESLTKLDVMTDVSKFSTQPESEVDYNSCKYYSVREIQNLNAKNNLNIFHSNINRLGSKFATLYEFISSTSSEFDIIAITETSQKNNELSTTNVAIQGYKEFYTPNSSK